MKDIYRYPNSPPHESVKFGNDAFSELHVLWWLVLAAKTTKQSIFKQVMQMFQLRIFAEVKSSPLICVFFFLSVHDHSISFEHQPFSGRWWCKIHIFVIRLKPLTQCDLPFHAFFTNLWCCWSSAPQLAPSLHHPNTHVRTHTPLMRIYDETMKAV